MDEDNLTEVPRARTGRPRVDEGAVMTFLRSVENLESQSRQPIRFSKSA